MCCRSRRTRISTGRGMRRLLFAHCPSRAQCGSGGRPGAACACHCGGSSGSRQSHLDDRRGRAHAQPHAGRSDHQPTHAPIVLWDGQRPNAGVLAADTCLSGPVRTRRRNRNVRARNCDTCTSGRHMAPGSGLARNVSMKPRMPYREKTDAIAAERMDGTTREAINSRVGRLRHGAGRIECANHSGRPGVAVGADARGRDILDRRVQATRRRRDVRRPFRIYREIKPGSRRSDVLHSPILDRRRRNQQSCVPLRKRRTRALGRNHPMPYRARAVLNGEHHSSRQDRIEQPKRFAAYRPHLAGHSSATFAPHWSPRSCLRARHGCGTNVMRIMQRHPSARNLKTASQVHLSGVWRLIAQPRSALRLQ